jgi:hypothetical protein
MSPKQKRDHDIESARPVGQVISFDVEFACVVERRRETSGASDMKFGCGAYPTD